jgi:hypothetical protein
MIPVYKYEIAHGIAEKVKSNASVAYTSKITEFSDNFNIDILLNSSASANPNQIDLFYLESVLASVGWNANDDVFDIQESWGARNTPIDKPFNFMHNEKDIIGHLTSSKVVDFEGKVIPDNAVIDQLPDKFDIVVGSVLYKTWSDSTLQQRMIKLVEEIIAGKWCVSMECLFRNFDYAVKNIDDSINKIVARSDETSFLTKHLRIYGGSGEYQGYRIGRLLRNFTFSGKGLVDNPANPRSHITSFNDSRESSLFAGASIATVEELQISNKEKVVMSDVVYTKEQYEALKAELDQFKAASQQAAQNEIDGLKQQIAQISTELEASKEVSKAKEEKVVALEAELTDTQTKLAEAAQSIKDAEVQAITAARKALLLERVDEDKAENLVQKFANASQEMFDALVDSLPKKSEVSDAKCGEDKMDDEEEEETEAEVTTDLEDAKADDKAEMASGSTQEEETLRSKAAAWLANNVLRATNKKKD